MNHFPGAMKVNGVGDGCRGRLIGLNPKPDSRGTESNPPAGSGEPGAGPEWAREQRTPKAVL